MGRIIIAIFRLLSSKNVILRLMDYTYPLFLYYNLVDYLFLYKPDTNVQIRAAMNFNKIIAKIFLFWMGIVYPLSIFQTIYFQWHNNDIFKDNQVLFTGLKENSISKLLPIFYIIRRIFVILYFVPGFDKQMATLFVVLLIFIQLLVTVL